MDAHGALVDNSSNKNDKDIVLALVKIISRDSALHSARELIVADVQIYMDSKRYVGLNIWFKWIHFLHCCGRISNLRLNVDSIWIEAGCVCISCSWQGSRGSQPDTPLVSRKGRLRYLVENNRITKIWTYKTNYGFIFGKWMECFLGYKIFELWFFLYFFASGIRGGDFDETSLS